MIVSLLASGSGHARHDRAATGSAGDDRGSGRQTGSRPRLTQSTLGLVAIDVADVSGPVVVSVEANGPANGRIQIGDSIASIDGQPVTDVAVLAKLISGRQPGKPMAVELKDAKGAAKKADVDVVVTAAADWHFRSDRAVQSHAGRSARAARAAGDPFQQSVIRLNTAVVLARLGECAIARDELKQVQLPDRPRRR
jgi:hypothetical protein